MYGTGITFDRHTDTVPCFEVFEEKVEELFESFTVVLYFVVEEVVNGITYRVVYDIAVGEGMCLFVVVPHEHVSVVGLEIGCSGCRQFGLWIWLVVMEVQFDREEMVYSTFLLNHDRDFNFAATWCSGLFQFPSVNVIAACVT